ncbi:uncharacterized protein PHALS_13226 [Plasmopara halstedii]|uniref:Uncharacterized protein n=1 Tax=Plasmopara halstedii TaxID=4781 RepID=A0A0P1AP17_PLAHL|nr:uncharacterized protein PHALS_13226 [Plasmopara halstedii]CEG42999.1 hypothetical protein PHALS_13226 [Plasmopara halstedii]|eukprot:XP_024579368.1 hypothetical protein PHALS_13226 [Plasmopara halstedii]
MRTTGGTPQPVLWISGWTLDSRGDDLWYRTSSLYPKKCSIPTLFFEGVVHQRAFHSVS